MRLTKQLCLLCAAAALLAPPSRLPAQSAAPAGPAAANGEIAELQLSIAQAMELARTNADEVRARAAGLEAALQGERVARAALYPSLSASASGAYLANPPEGISVAKGSLGSLTVPDGTGGYKTIEMPSQDFVVVKNAEDTYFKGNLTFTQPIVAWGKIRASMDIATMEAELALTGREGAARDAAREANRAYYSAKLALESQAILEGLQTLAASIVADRSASLELGLGTKERLLSAQADRAAIDAQLVGARESATTALQSLSALTGIAAGKSIDLVSDFRDGLPALDEESL
ncbi:MAG TPA: TolC family protein, partial [Rectinemataceae bacterium]|nr:TolC family protein [Rectinemataceae bacterium]